VHIKNDLKDVDIEGTIITKAPNIYDF